MPITKETIGRHKNIAYLEFGEGDIAFTIASQGETDCPNALVFTQCEPGEIGRELPSMNGKGINDLEKVKVIMEFLNSQSVEVVIKYLSILKKEMKKAGK